MAAGARSPYQLVASKPGYPDSARAGTSGAAADRVNEVTRQCSELAFAHERHDDGYRAEHHGDATGQQIRNGRDHALVGDMPNVDRGPRLEQRGWWRRGWQEGRARPRGPYAKKGCGTSPVPLFFMTAMH